MLDIKTTAVERCTRPHMTCSRRRGIFKQSVGAGFTLRFLEQRCFASCACFSKRSGEEETDSSAAGILQHVELVP